MYVFPYDKKWQYDYEDARANISAAFVHKIALYHVGSTAVEGLHAKNCIDILGVVNSFSCCETGFAGVSSLGYMAKGEYGIKGRRYFSKLRPKVHLHIFETGNPEISKHLKFVELMRTSESLRSELNILKQELQEKYPNNRKKYQIEKSCFYDKLHQDDL